MEAKTLPTTKQHSQTKCSISYNYIATSVAKAAYKTNLHRRQTPVQLKLDQAITSLDIYTPVSSAIQTLLMLNGVDEDTA